MKLFKKIEENPLVFWKPYVVIYGVLAFVGIVLNYKDIAKVVYFSCGIIVCIWGWYALKKIENE
jgi:hypothetical protein